jgi:hypothetical protein
MVKASLLSIGLFALLTRLLCAGTLVYSDSEFLLTVGSVGTFSIPQYTDPGGMPLTKVTLRVAADSFGGSNTFDNEDHAGGAATVAIGTDVKVSGPLIGSPLIVHAVPVNTNSGFVAGDNDGAPDFLGTDSIKITGTIASDLQSASRTAAFDIAPYEGAGWVTFDYSTLTSTAGSFSTTGGGANFVDFGSISAEFTATITYEFVPEPSCIVLALVGSMVVGRFSFRRRSR